MPERDWQKDWDMCNCAYPGPWEVIFGSDKVYINLNGRRLIVLPITDRRWDEVDFTLITEAREALPYWLQRVRELEERNNELEGALGAIMAVIGREDAAR